ncbi:MAG: mechanosensitive ion channel family protein [Candidatus Saganbacteria bacterium]|nr:mechanosensitive ion channel family protein [Candidatus Saganbacteria bacterium]
MNIDQVLKFVFFDNSVQSYLYALAVFVGIMIVVHIFKTIILIRLKKIAKQTPNLFDDYLVSLVEKNFMPLFYFAAFYLAAQTLTIREAFRSHFDLLTVAVLVLIGINFVIRILDSALKILLLKPEDSESKKKSMRGILNILKGVIWIVGVILLLDNLGFKVSAIIAGLGVGGIAIALAAQAMLGDLFSYFAIFFDRPFEIGDFIIVGDMMGSVEYVGIKTTRLRSLGGEQLVFSNSDLTNSRVRNYKRMQKRRVVFKLGTVYETTSAQVKEIPEIIKNTIKNTPDSVFDRAHFFEFGDFSLIFEVVYIVLSSDYNKYMDIQQSINFALKEEFEKRGIEFAFPTQTLYVNKTA